MKKIKKVFLSLALVLIMIIPMVLMTGCDLSDLFGEKEKTNNISSIGLTKNIKTEYNFGEEIDFNGAKLLLRYEDDTEKEITLTTDLVSNFDSTTFGNKTLTIAYKGKEISVNYKVYPNLTGCKWCASKMFNGQYESALDANSFSSGYMYFVFNSNNRGCCYSYYNSKFESAGEFDYNFKNNSLNEIEIINIGGRIDNCATMEILSDTQIKFYIDGGYFILTKDYYNI